MTIHAVLLDIDGTMLDSNDAHAEAWVRVLAQAGYRVPFEAARRQIGMGADHLLPNLTGILSETARGKAISKTRTALFLEEYLPQLRPTPGARALVERLQADGLRIVVATSANEQELASLIEAAGIADLIDAQTTSSDAKQSKPNPDIIAAALGRTHGPPDEALMLGDTPYDVQAARSARVRTVAFRCGGWNDADLAEAIAIYDDPADLLRHYDDSPFTSR